MGRRPNQLVNNFFERGRKIADSSNRYEHTCKRCGDLFPKGRVTVLLNHILRKCVRASREDREAVDHYIRHPEEHAIIQAYGPAFGQLPVPRYDSNDRAQVPSQAEARSASVEEQSPQTALETLAEASRHHPEIHVSYTAPAVEDQSLMGQLRRAAELREHQSNRLNGIRETYRGPDISRVETPPPVHRIHSYIPSPQPGFHEVPDLGPQQTVEPEPDEVNGAEVNDFDSDRSALLDQHDEVFPANDHQLQPFVNVQAEIDSPGSWGAADDDGLPMVEAPLAQTLPQPAPLPTSESQPANNSRLRNKYTDERRKQVSENRRRGACLRCRMLKKPCSDGDPCSACSSIEAARLWQGTCVRTRLAEVFTLWSSGLFQSRIKIEISSIVQGFCQLNLPGRMEARLTPFANLCVSFACKQYSESQDVGEQIDVSIEGSDSMKNVWLLEKESTMPDKVQRYIRAVADAVIEQEPSPFLKATLQQARLLIPAEEAVRDSTMNGPRLSYKLRAELLQDAIELWVETQVLTLSTTRYLELRHNPAEIPRPFPESVDWDHVGSHSITREVTALSHTHALVTKQLLAVLEDRMAVLSKNIISELEKRLLQRQQISRFGTFIAAVLLLNCVERITGLYRALDDRRTNSNEVPSGWPLDKPPNQFWPQGEQFANLLTLLLRIRGIPPRTFAGPDGVLGVVRDIKQKGSEEEQLADLSSASSWLQPLQLSVSDLKLKANCPEPAADEEPQSWDLRYISRVLLP